MFRQKLRQRNNIPADPGHFLRTEIDSIDLENENLTAKIRRNKAEKPYFKKKIFQKNFKQTRPLTKIKNKYLKKYWTKK